VARLAISKGFLAEYVKLSKDLQRAVDQAIAAFARDSQPALQLETPEHGHDDRIGIMAVNGHWRGVVLTPGDTWPEDTYSLVTVLPQDQVDAYVTNYLFRASQPLEVLAAFPEEASPQEASTAEVGAGEASSGLQTPSEAEPLPAAVSEAIPNVRQAAPPEAPAPDDHVTCGPEPEKVPRSLVHPLTAWRAHRRSRRMARGGTCLTEPHAAGPFGPEDESGPPSYPPMPDA
jgi:hypothetical protein